MGIERVKKLEVQTYAFTIQLMVVNILNNITKFNHFLLKLQPLHHELQK